MSFNETGWEGRVRVLALANGKTFGNGLYIAPDAMVDDGMLSVFVAEDMPLARFLVYLQRLRTCARIENQSFQYLEARHANLCAPEPCALEADGEWVGWLPAVVEAISARVKFLR